MNEYYRASNAGLQTTSVQMSTTISTNPVPFGLTVPQADALELLVTAFSDARTAVETRRAEYASAVQDQKAARAALVALMSEYATTIYNKPTVTDAMIASLGLVPRDTSPSTASPITPTDFAVTPHADGSIQLSWKRNGNSPRAAFVIEMRDPGGEWSVLSVVSKTKAQFFGFNPGTEKWFRVYTTLNGEASAPSFEAPIYAAMPSGPSISMAA